ncbi:MAG: tRNA pseudouridine(38-40) synthase TruA [Rhodospirillaceae bacterium]|nr:tRNA pseudouridine(38-40) synthase TruA [Rhodospirillaceae bacterium]
MTRRFRLTLEYDGGPFVGWQRQDNGLSVQQCLEEAVEKFCGERLVAYAAGRTDSGVHALGQVVHIDIARDAEPFRIKEALNYHLKPRPIAVIEAEPVDDSFHARFSAVERRYRYRIVNRRAPLALDAGRAWQVGRPLDAEAMHEAALPLVGHHDFSSFRAAECQAKSPVKTLTDIRVSRYGEEIEIALRAPSFLHHQVRNIVGTLAPVGEGKKPVTWLATVLRAADRRKAGATAPACGLYLDKVVY